MKGVRRTATGWQVFARVKGIYKSRRLPLTATPKELEEARERLRAEVLYHLPAPAKAGETFADDAAAYLALVATMPSYADRAYHIKLWTRVFGDRPRSSITAREIRGVLEQWRKTGRQNGGPLTQGSLNRRRTALLHLYTVLDGKSGSNTVRDVPPYNEAYSQQVRAESMVTCARLVKRLKPRGKMRGVLYVLLWTGWPHALLKTVTPADIDWQRQRVRLQRRQKAKGMPPAWVPVLPRAIIGLRRLVQRKHLGAFSNSSLHTALARAIQRENVWRRARDLSEIGAFNPYGFRHSFATWAATRIKDDRALKELLRTSSIHRYTEGALADRLAEALASLHRK